MVDIIEATLLTAILIGVCYAIHLQDKRITLLTEIIQKLIEREDEP